MDKKQYLDESILILDTFYSELRFYKDQIQLLKKHKPSFFNYNQYDKELKELENKIVLCENKIKNFIDNN